MDISSLPEGKKLLPEDLSHFPTRWQAVLWRNWGLVPAEKIAQVLKTSVEELRNAAGMLGLDPDIKTDSDWLAHGYLTILRSNWHLLNYEQLLELLSWSAERMHHALTEEDFLWIKVGQEKPVCPPVYWSCLTTEEQKKTEKIRSFLAHHFPGGLPERKEKAFAFLQHIPIYDPVVQQEDFLFNFIAPYSASCGDIFDEDDPLPDIQLARYAAMGIQGIWLHAVLYHLVPIPGAEKYSAGWQNRRKKLKALAEKCKKYGLKIYLYLNEPRSLPLSFFELKPEWAGLELPQLETRTICTNHSPEPLQWLESAMREVWQTVPALGGAFCITMSENPTNCHYRANSGACPYCKNVPPAQIIADILSAMERGMHAAAPEARLIASTWGWQKENSDVPDIPAAVVFAGEIISRLPVSVSIATVSENSLALNIGGVKQPLGDYSISQVGPSEKSLLIWQKAREYGLSVVAKVQLNNSWELSAVPWIPVPYLVQEHLHNLKQAGVSGLMLSWTHGGYPGGNLELLRATPEEIASVRFSPENAPKVCCAWRQFSEAFRQFPFCKDIMYMGPVNRGPGNRFYMTPTERHATMLCFPFDDLKSWRGYYPESVFSNQIALLLAGWAQGMKTLAELSHCSDSEKETLEELKRIAETAECHFKSAFNQIKFVQAREKNDAAQMRQLAAEEMEITKKLLTLVCADARLGFEASNHYFYTLNDLFEKVISCCLIEQELMTEQ